MPVSVQASTSGAPVRPAIVRPWRLACTLAALLLALPLSAQADQWFVAPGAAGNGSSAAPFGTIQQALGAAQPGDTITIAAGTYAESLTTVRAGAAGAPITIQAAPGGAVIVTKAGRVLTVRHPHVVVDGLVIDGQYGASDTVKIESAADGFVLRRATVRRSSRDCIDMSGPSGVLIEQSTIHNCLWWNGGRQDAHAVVAGAVRDLTLRGLDVHTFSGDGFQVDPGRSAAGWDRVVIEDSTFSLQPLAAAENGFAAGMVPGENAVDTKINVGAPRASLTIRNTIAAGFRGGLINNMAAFNLKEQVDVVVERVTVRDSEIGFRVRGPGANGGAWVRVQNAVLHDVTTGVRYEDDIESLEVVHTTFGAGVSQAFDDANSGRGGVNVSNSLFLAGTLPVEAPAGGGNLAVGTAAFLNAAGHDYALAPGSPAIDSAGPAAEVVDDRAGAARPQGAASDIGAFERPAASAPPPPPAPAVLTAVKSPVDPTNAVVLSWLHEYDDRSGYEIERSADGVSFARVKTVSASATTFTLSKLVSGRNYWFRVRALLGAQPPAAYTNTVEVALDPEVSPPASPPILSVTPHASNGTSQLTLQWADVSLNEDGFEVERSTDGVQFTRISKRGVNQTSYTDKGRASGTTYWYRVRAYNSLGRSAYGPIASARTH